MKRMSKPNVINASPPTLPKPRLVKMSQSLDSSPSGLCRSSSFSTSSGYNKRLPPDKGRMLYFSETVWVFMSSSLPALDTGRESANGFSNPLESFDSQLDLLDEKLEEAGD